MLDDAGLALARRQPIGKLLQEYEADLERRRGLCAILADYALLECRFSAVTNPPADQQ